MKPEISAVVFAAKPPQVLKPLVTSKGVHLILVEEIIEPKLTDMLRKKNLSNLFSAWVKQQMAQSEFVTNFAPGNPNLTSGYQVINAQHLVTATFS
jgi:parvulin-like peptidyl-prolyl isomerase